MRRDPPTPSTPTPSGRPRLAYIASSSLVLTDLALPCLVLPDRLGVRGTPVPSPVGGSPPRGPGRQ
eukprot:9292447-Pyramimonas_sp.AAC.1